MKFDFATISVPEHGETVLEAFQEAHDYAKFSISRGQNSFNRGGYFTSYDQNKIAEFYWDMPTSPKITNVWLRGRNAHNHLPWFRENYQDHNTTRLDSCEDYTFPGAWDQITGIAYQVRERFNLKSSNEGDWHPHHGHGRTLYIGSRRSAVFLRIYEKGKQLQNEHDEIDLDWVRAEIQVRPPSRNKNKYTNVNSVQLWSATNWSREFFHRLTGLNLPKLKLDPLPRSDNEKREIALLRQYGPHLDYLLEQHGSADNVGNYLYSKLVALRTLDKQPNAKKDDCT